MKNSPDEKKPLKMVRSSIACARCRRSKVKCVNNGPNSTCKSCAQSNRECTYPVAGSSPSMKRTDAMAGISQSGETNESKKRSRKIEDSGRRISQRVKEDVLDSPILTRKVWDEIFELFKLHFSTEMPFLHPPTFRNRMRQAAFPRDASASPADLEEGRILLLGVLTLTARFHPGLIAHHSPNGADPLAASEYYAAPLTSALGNPVYRVNRPSIESIQALLMLGLFDWGQMRGLSAWINVGLAIRLAFSIGLAYVDAVDDQPLNSRSQILSNSRESAIEKEVRRRTMWSCFIMDRMLSAGKNRPVMIDVDKLAVHLPCSDDQFLFVHNVASSISSPKWITLGGEHGSTPNDDGVLSLYLRLIEIFGDLSNWSFTGGRSREKLLPWDESSEFFHLRQKLRNFEQALPPSLTFTEANLSAHIEKRNATTYASLHTLYSLCLIILHRDYIPFIPLRCEKPSGPIDGSILPLNNMNSPDGFWEESAKTIMKSSRDVIEIVRTCQDNNALPESPLIGFAAWQAAFFCVYTLWFPQMDLEGHLVDQACPESEKRIRGKGLISVAQKLLRQMAATQAMVKGYLETIEKMHRYYYTVYRDYSLKFKRGEVVDQFKNYERELRDCGEMKDADQTPSEVSEDQNRSRASTNDIAPNSTSGETLSGMETANPRQNGSWAPINASSPVEEDRSKYVSHSQHPYGIPYTSQQSHLSPAHASVVPSMIASNSDMASSCIDSISSPGSHQHAQPTALMLNPMPPPTEGIGMTTDNDDKAYQKWIQCLEKITMHTGFDNFAQEAPMEQFIRDSLNYQGHRHPNFLQAVWALPCLAEVDARHASY